MFKITIVALSYIAVPFVTAYIIACSIKLKNKWRAKHGS